MRRPFKRRTFKRKRRTYKRASRVARIATVRRMISRSEESKWFQSNTGPSNATAFDFADPFCAATTNIVLGDTRVNRQGTQITLNRLELDCRCFLNPAGGAGYVSRAAIRVVVFADKANNGVNFSALTAAQQVAFLMADSATGNAYYSALNPIYFPSKFKLLMDKRFVMHVTGGATDTAQLCVWRKFLRVRGMKVQYNDANAGVPTDIQRNAIYIWATTDVGASGLNLQPQLTFSYLMKWKDA